MSLSSIPNTIFSPLTSNDELIKALQAASGEPREVVINRLYSEQLCGGMNVKNDAADFGIVPYVWSENLIEFYKTTKAFLYESAVWNRAPLKRQMRQWIGQFLIDKQLADAKVLLYGDGLGFDSAFLSMLGCTVQRRSGCSSRNIPRLRTTTHAEPDVCVRCRASRCV